MVDFNNRVSDSDMNPHRYHYQFIHNVFGNFFKDSLDYFTSYLYPRFEYRVVGTYDKAVQYLKDQADLNREVDMPNLPALILNPTGEFLPAEASSGGRQLWRYPNLAPGMIKRIFDPVYQDANNQVHVGFIRIKGEIELLMLTNSFYEYCDLRLYAVQIFGGLDRWIYPRFFTSFIILPEELVNYRYTNEYTGQNYKLDWSSINATSQLVKSTARNEYVLPCTIKPQYKMTGMSDNSSRYGGTDKIADWRLGVSIEYEIEIPSFWILEADYLAENIHLEVRYGSAYSSYSNYQPPVNRQLTNFHWDSGLDETSNSTINLSDATSEMTFIGDYVYETRYFHIVTADEADSTADVVINIPEEIDFYRKVIVNSRYGELDYGDHWTLADDGESITIKVDNVELVTGMIIEIYVYVAQ